MKAGDCRADLPVRLIEKAREQGYSKIFAKVRADQASSFLKTGYRAEAEVPGFYKGKQTAVFLGYYLDKARSRSGDQSKLEAVRQLAEKKTDDGESNFSQLDKRFVLKQCSESDAERMARIYQTVFPSYPFPVHEPDYLIETMRSHIDYFCVEKEGELVALSSTEKDVENQNAEMTDFATLPEWRGLGFAKFLLAFMEERARENAILTAYTIARAISPGMNITFSRLGYVFGGQLVNNTQISGNLESMNVWYKSLE